MVFFGYIFHYVPSDNVPAECTSMNFSCAQGGVVNWSGGRVLCLYPRNEDSGGGGYIVSWVQPPISAIAHIAKFGD